jgi:acyl-CoA thioester hydrolase
MPRQRVLTPLRWSDMDAYGHVNNVQFLRLLEDARVVAFAAAGSDHGGTMVDTGLLVAGQRIEYLEPLVYRTAPVAIDLWVTKLSAASFDLGYEVLDDADTPSGTTAHGHAHDARPVDGARVYARAETTLVTYDLVQGRPRRMSADERLRLEDWQDEPVVWRRSHSR